MRFRSRNTPCLECWNWQGFRIRCALFPDEPRQLELHWALGRQLVEHGLLCPWQMSLSTLNLLMDTASDTALPWHWRSLCLDHAYRSLYALQHLAIKREQQGALNQARNRLATLRMQPSISISELEEGNPYA